MRPSALIFRAAIIAGIVADIPNALALHTFDDLGIRTAHSGLLVVVKSAAEHIEAGSPIWHDRIASAAAGPAAQHGFHLLVALSMAVFYGFVVEPLLGRIAPWIKGIAFGAAVWIANALLVLPLAGDGLAGLGAISVTGAACFALAHFLFFVTLAAIFPGLAEALSSPQRRLNC